jgi:hypothetical protein
MNTMTGLLLSIIDVPWKTILSQILTFLYSLAHYVGLVVVYLLGIILPTAKLPGDLADPIGYLALLTAFVILAQVAKKVTWIVVIVGWALIVIRIVLVVFGY